MAHRVPGKFGRTDRSGGAHVAHKRSHPRAALSQGRTSPRVHAAGGTLAFPIPEALPKPAERPVPNRADPATKIPATQLGDRDTGFSSYFDAELVQLFAHSRDEGAFAELYHRHKAEIYTYCVRMMSGDRDAASDIFQEVFIKAFERAEQFRSGTNVGGWLYVIARNQCLNAHRNEHPAERLDADDSAIGMLPSQDRSLAPEYDEEQHFLRRKLEEALARLPLEFREPFMLREFDGFSYAEIAEMTGSTVGMIKVRIYRAKQRMRELLAPALRE